MGIYSSGKIFGIRIYNFDEDDYGRTLFEKKYDATMNDEQKREAYLFYNDFDNKDEVLFNIYTECSSTLDKSGILGTIDAQALIGDCAVNLRRFAAP
jgi:hypothetical protein